MTGAGQGIGEAIATRFSHRGDRVAVLDIDLPAAQNVARRLQSEGGLAVPVHVDVTSDNQVGAAIAAVLAELGPVEVLVNNAGRNTYLDPVTMSEGDWDDAFAVDLKAAWLMTRACLPSMLTAGAGAVVNISSIHARLTVPGMFPYAAAKSGLEGLTRSLALEYAKHGVRVNAVAPGWTHTRLVNEWLARTDDPNAFEGVLRAHPLGRIVDPDDVAAAVEFLAGDGARSITGVSLPVDAGLSVTFRVD